MAEQIVAEVEYREVVGFPGYRVGDDGSVWSCRKRGRQDGRAKGEWSLLRAKQDRDGYAMVVFSIDSKRHYRRVHRLVLELFVGPCPDGMEACHFPINDRTCNHLSNLRWDTREGNRADMIIHGTSHEGERHHRAKITSIIAMEIRTSFASGESTAAKLANTHGVSQSVIYKITAGKIWRRAGGRIVTRQRRIEPSDENE